MIIGSENWCANEESFLWCRLSPERVSILQLAGVDMVQESLSQWVHAAIDVAKFLAGSNYSSTAAAPAGSWPDESAFAQQSIDDGDVNSTPAATDEAHVQMLPSALTSRSASAWQPLHKMGIRRWVQTQNALAEERRLTPAQFRYMTVLGEIMFRDFSRPTFPEHRPK